MFHLCIKWYTATYNSGSYLKYHCFQVIHIPFFLLSRQLSLRIVHSRIKVFHHISLVPPNCFNMQFTLVSGLLSFYSVLPVFTISTMNVFTRTLTGFLQMRCILHQLETIEFGKLCSTVSTLFWYSFNDVPEMLEHQIFSKLTHSIECPFLHVSMHSTLQRAKHLDQAALYACRPNSPACHCVPPSLKHYLTLCIFSFQTDKGFKRLQYLNKST